MASDAENMPVTTDQDAAPTVLPPAVQRPQQSYQQSSAYFSTYIPQPVSYAPQITVDEDQSQLPYSTPQYANQTPQYTTVQYGTVRYAIAPPPIYPQPTATPPPTTQSWRAEVSTAERLRLGLRRYRSEEEERRAIEQAVNSATNGSLQ